MRITAKAKEETRARITQAARSLFAHRGFEATTTRDIAKQASIATGTLFNYFPTKESLGLAMVAEALHPSAADVRQHLSGTEPLDETLFLFVVSGLRRLEPLRAFIAPIIETGLSPLVHARPSDSVGARIQADHLDMVTNLLATHRGITELPRATLHLYWTLYCGVLVFWSRDPSPHQKNTLAVLGQSLKLFVASLDQPGSIQTVEDTR